MLTWFVVTVVSVRLRTPEGDRCTTIVVSEVIPAPCVRSAWRAGEFVGAGIAAVEPARLLFAAELVCLVVDACEDIVKAFEEFRGERLNKV